MDILCMSWKPQIISHEKAHSTHHLSRCAAHRHISIMEISVWSSSLRMWFNNTWKHDPKIIEARWSEAGHYNYYNDWQVSLAAKGTQPERAEMINVAWRALTRQLTLAGQVKCGCQEAEDGCLDKILCSFAVSWPEPFHWRGSLVAYFTEGRTLKHWKTLTTPFLFQMDIPPFT